MKIIYVVSDQGQVQAKENRSTLTVSQVGKGGLPPLIAGLTAHLSTVSEVTAVNSPTG